MCQACKLTQQAQADIALAGQADEERAKITAECQTNEERNSKALGEAKERKRLAERMLDEARCALAAHRAKTPARPVDTARLRESLARRSHQLQSSMAALSATLADLLAERQRADALTRNAELAREQEAKRKIFKAALTELRDLRLLHSCHAVTSHANDFIRDFWDGRFEIRLNTQRETKNDTVRSDFVPVIINRETGREASDLSGGETVIVDEAMRLAISATNAEAFGLRIETTWRDEAGAALDPDNARRYLQLLRRYMERVGGHQLLLITHDPALQAGADRQIRIEEGALTVP